ncbi:hypothetical protein [Sphingomonas melonis]|uniref:hypothetical protein n=1 Tax=Sphingomonas melonis TaxID=152682 RepID=UPI00369ACB97
MGLSSSKTKQTNEPSAFAKPYISAGANALQSAYGQSQGVAQGISDTLAAQLPGLAQLAFNPSQGLTAATDYNTKVLNGGFLGAGNPYLQGQIDQTNAGVSAKVNGAFSSAGRTGSGANVNALGRALAANETGLRYTDYSNERQAMAQAAALAPSLDAARFSGLGAYLQAANGAVGIPLSAAGQYAGGLGSLLGQYNTQTGTTSQGLGSILGSVAGAGLAGWASGGFRGI